VCTQFLCQQLLYLLFPMKVGRTSLCGMRGPETKHLFWARCFMHAFALLMGTMLSHAWARSIVTRAQRIVTYFKASHRPLGLLQIAARQTLEVTGEKYAGLRSANTTRFTSVHMMLSSVYQLERALKSVVVDHGSEVKSGPVKRDLGDASFWKDLEQLVKLLQPLSEVIMAIQGDHSTLADVTRYFLYLARKLEIMLPTLGNQGKLGRVWV
jgi:hypothetical protein